MASQQDVAKLANVSFMTVSRVVNNQTNVSAETRERVLKAIKELGYYPNAAARALNSNRSKNVGVIFPRSDYLLIAPFCIEFCIEVERRLKLDGYHLFLGSLSDESETKDLPALFREGKVDGIIIFAPKNKDEGVERLAADGFPFVVVHGRSDRETVSYVDSDNEKGSALLMDYLFSLGHRRIGFVSGNMDAINSIDRLNGYRRALSARGIDYDESLVYYGDWSLESGHAGFKALVQGPDRPTAIFFSNDQMAIGAIKAARDLNLRIPADISITGFDDIKYASFIEPPLTTVRQNIGLVGEAVAELILETIREGGSDRKIVLEPELVIRDSCRSIAGE